MRPYYDQDGVVIYHGDCREVLPGLPGFTTQHVITDPPFGKHVYERLRGPQTHKGSGTPARMGIGNHQYSSRSIEALGADAIGSIDEMLAAVAEQIALRTNRWAIVFSDVESCHLWREQLELAGMRYVRTGAWVKTDPMPQFSGDRPSAGFESATICHAQGPMRWNGGGHAATWIHGIAKTGRPDHPCPKPLPLMRDLVGLFTDLHESILDPFMGSGTTLVAAKALNRQAVGIEINEKYCEIAAERLRQRSLFEVEAVG